MYQFYIFQTLQRSENYYYELLTCNDTKNRVKLKCVCFRERGGVGFDIHSNVPKSMAIEKGGIQKCLCRERETIVRLS